MLQKHLNNPRAEELQEQWALLNRQLAELEKDRITETRTETRLRLDQVIARVKEDRWRLEKELQELETQPKIKTSAAMQASQDDICPPWLREQLLRRFRNDLTCRLESFFGEHCAAELPKTLSPTDVSRFHSQREKILEYSLEQAGFSVWATERSVVEIFNQPDIGRRLIVLGEPGSGKTSCLLQVFRHLLEAAEDNRQEQIPVVFECSEWNGKDLPSWMAHQLVVKYDLNKDRAGKLIQGDLIFPFFDGLDELCGELQEAFVEAFNAFQHGQPMLLCCRIKEYRQLEKKVQLNNALVLHDISLQRLEKYLQQEGQEDLWRLLQVEPTLMELARRPLFLSIILKLEEEKLLSDNAKLKSGEDAEQFLWRLYVKCCLKGAPASKIYSGTSDGKRYTKEQSLHWLRCLAEKMTAKGIVELRIEEIQPSWLKHPWQFKVAFYLIYGMIVGMAGWISAEAVYGRMIYSSTFGLVGAITFVLFIWLTRSYNSSIHILFFSSIILANGMLLYFFEKILAGYGGEQMLIGYDLVFRTEYILAQERLAPILFLGFILGGNLGITAGWAWFFSKRTSTTSNPSKQIDKIKKVKLIRFPTTIQNIKKTIEGVGLGLLSGLLCGLCLGVVMEVIFIIGVCLTFGLAIGLSLGLNKNENPVLTSNVPGKNITYAVRASLLIAPIFSTASMLVFVQIFLLAEQFGFYDTSFFSMSFFLHIYLLILFGCFLFAGADIAFIHYMLRLLLWQEDQLPFRLVSWLEDLHQRKLLQRVGGSYHFIHKRLQEYLAQMNDAETVP